LSTLQRLFCCLTVCASLGACASSGAARGEAGATLLVSLQNLRTGECFELASVSHTDPVAYYSDARNDAARKVTTDEIMSAFVGELDRQGFGKHARPGRAPAIGSGDVIRWGLEVESGTGRAHWLIGTGSSPDDWQAFQKCRDMFLELYNFTVSYQAVENPSGKGFFDDKTRAAGQKKH
jgi:hypothetical protein